SMAKLRMYWLSEIRKELEHYGKDLTEEELRACANFTTIPIDLSLQDDIFNDNEPCITNQNISTSVFTPVNSDIFMTFETKLNIEDIADLTLSFFNFNNIESRYEKFQLQSRPTSSQGRGNMDFEVSNIVDEVLGNETDDNYF
ncbi:4983_t:CDS:1, partial [Cetraspora pellucida]